MLRPLHPLVLSVPGLMAHADHLPLAGQIPAGHMCRFRMDGSLPPDLAVRASEYTVLQSNGDLARQDDQRTDQIRNSIEKRLDETTRSACDANEALDACMSGQDIMSPGIPGAWVTMEWHLPSVMTQEYKRANMTFLRPAIGNFPEGSPARRALSDKHDHRDEVQIFILYPGTSHHSQMRIRQVIDAEISLWARALKIDASIMPASWAEIPLTA